MAKDPLFSNKIMGALLFAGVIASGSGFVASIVYTTDKPSKNAYIIETGEEDEVASSETADADPTAWEGVSLLLTTLKESGGNPLEGATGTGEKLFKKCSSCHTIASGGANKVGPNLWNIVGSKIASVEGYNYSRTLQGMSDETWSPEKLNAFLTSPKTFASGTKMSFKGISKIPERAALILYLESQSNQ